ncbi:bacterioferritin [Granulibacter bethesdensis]|nr:bacterioferritin [Granulibacter bethesdensis]
MKADATTIQNLNKVLTNELTAINQYFLHARMLENWGMTKMGRHEFKESVEEMKHADELIKRILFLEGLPNVQRLNHVLIGETPEEVLQRDLELEVTAIADLREFIAYAESIRDFPTRDLLASILRDEEHHVDFIETQQDMINRMGVQNWVQLNSDAPDGDH